MKLLNNVIPVILGFLSCFVMMQACNDKTNGTRPGYMDEPIQMVDPPACEYKRGDFVHFEDEVAIVIEQKDCRLLDLVRIDGNLLDNRFIKEVTKMSLEEKLDYLESMRELMLGNLFEDRLEKTRQKERVDKPTAFNSLTKKAQSFIWKHPNKTCGKDCLYWDVPDFMCTNPAHNHITEEWIEL